MHSQAAILIYFNFIQFSNTGENTWKPEAKSTEGQKQFYNSLLIISINNNAKHIVDATNKIIINLYKSLCLVQLGCYSKNNIH
jgi:hypothetical protein